MGITYFPCHLPDAHNKLTKLSDKLIATDFLYTTPYNESYICNVILTRYPNGQNCIRLEDIIYGEPVAHATTPVNLSCNDIVHIQACNEYVVIKDYCENDGMLKQLQAAGIVGETLLHINGIHSGIHMCPLLPLASESDLTDKIVDSYQGELPV
tara:strand:+ start:3382 stop:3843 length:462 start_codon:yes stop_codon:yes gene_type:complete